MSKFDDFDFLDDLERIDKKKNKKPLDEKPVKKVHKDALEERPVKKEQHAKFESYFSNEISEDDFFTGNIDMTDADLDTAEIDVPKIDVSKINAPKTDAPRANVKPEPPRKKKVLREEVAKHAIKKPEKEVHKKPVAHKKPARSSFMEEHSKPASHKKPMERDIPVERKKSASLEKPVSQDRDRVSSRAKSAGSVHDGVRTAARKSATGKSAAGRTSKQKKRGFMAGLLHMTAGDHIVVSTGILVLGLALITGSVFFGTRLLEKQVSSFNELGEDLTLLSQSGESGLFAATDAYVSSMSVVIETTEPDEEDEDEEIDNSVENEILLNMTSVEKDLKIKFINKRGGKLISGIAFEASVKGPDGKTTTYKDDDKDGIIHKKEMAPGKYEVAIVESAALSDYKYSTAPVSVTVKDKIEYKQIDVADEIKTESQVNVAQEDTAVQEAETAPALKDTVEWVESTKKAVGSDGESGEYTKIDKDDIPDPMKIAMGVSRFVPLEKEETEAEESEKDDDDKEKEEEEKKKKEEEEKKKKEEEEKKKKEEEEKKKEEEEKKKKEEEEQKKKEEEEQKKKEEEEAKKKQVTGISITAPSTLYVGDSDTLKAKVSGKNLDSNESVKWSVDDSSIASIDAGSGKITAKKAGTVKVTATSESDSSVKESCRIEVKGVTLSLDKSSISLTVGDSETVKATVSKGNVEWSTGNKDVATVDDGKITAKGKGETTITAKSKEDSSVTATCKVTVSDANTELVVKLDPEKVNVFTNETVELKASVSKESGSVTLTFETSDAKLATVSSDGSKCTVKGVTPGSVEVKVTAKDSKGSVSATCNVTVKLNPLEDDTSLLKDKDGNQVYIKNDKDKYVKATFKDYFKEKKFYIAVENTKYTYTGWQTIDGKTYFYTKDGKVVTGEQVIQGAKYTFGSDGALVLNSSSGPMGIDVSKWNGTIDWSAVKNSGVNYAIIRCGYRGSSTGALIQDPKFKANIKGAQAAGIKVGIYFFTQAVNEVEAVEEASMVLNLIKGYNISYPVFADVESSGGRGDGLSASARTSVVNAFCKTIQNGGYKAGVYANKTWFGSKMNASSLTGYKIWLAQYAAAPSYTTTRYDLWQYTSKGKVSGISGNVDMNISYLGY